MAKKVSAGQTIRPASPDVTRLSLSKNDVAKKQRVRSSSPATTLLYSANGTPTYSLKRPATTKAKTTRTMLQDSILIAAITPSTP
jgi:hypothetical protein